MKTIKFTLLGLIFIVLVFQSLLFAVPIDLSTAEDVAEFQLVVKEKTDDHSISDITIFQNDEGDTLAYIANLHPLGFIIVTTDIDITPILAYSFNSNFIMDDDENNILYHLVKNDMELRLQAISDTTFPKIQENNDLWNKYISEDIDYFLDSDFQQWPEEGTTVTSGWIETTWTQGGPYNIFCPLAPNSYVRSVTGCAATTLAQIVNYYCGYIGNKRFDDNDDYTSLTWGNDIIIDDEYYIYDFPSFPELNSYLDDLKIHYKENILENEDIASLNFACGVCLYMYYSCTLSTTSTPACQVLLEKYCYDSAEYISASTNPTFYSTLIANMMEGEPAELVIDKPGPGNPHSIICDGYNTNDFYHLNFGGGAFSPDYIPLAWYSLPDGMPSSYNNICHGTLNIKPPQGTIEGNVVLNSGNGNITDINILIGNRIYHPDINGDYSIEIPSKTLHEPPEAELYDITASLYGYIDSTIIDVQVYQDQTTLDISFTLYEYEPVIINVPDDQPTIQSGIDAANDCDTVLVSEGTYYENINFNLKRITVCSKYVIENDESYITNTIIDGNQNGHVVEFSNGEDLNAILTGFTITNGYANEGGGVYIKSSSPRLEHLIITENCAFSFGSGIYCYNASPCISKVSIVDNEGEKGAISCARYSYPILKNVNIIDNHAWRTGGGIDCSNSDPNLINVTISGNTIDNYQEGGGVYCLLNSTPTLVNCIIWDNTQQSIYLGDNCDVIATYSDIEGGWTGEGNEYINPLFVNPENYDYSLSQVSPCIDAGNPDPQYNDPDDTRADMGPFTAKLENYTFVTGCDNWVSFPILNPNKTDAYDFFEPLILNGSLRRVKYMDYYLYYDEETGVWVNDIGDLRTVDGYKVEMYEPDSISLYGYKVPPNTTIYLYAEVDKAPWPPPLGDGNWIGYFIPGSQLWRIAFSQIWDKITFIKADDWSYISGYSMPSSCTVDYGKLYIVGVSEDCSFIWQGFGQSPAEPYKKQQTEVFTYEEAFDYMPVFVDSTEAVAGIDEIGVFLADECIGASKVEDFPVFVPAYIEEDSTGNKDFNELTFQVATYGKGGKRSIPAFVYNETQNTFVQEPVILDAKSYAIVRLGTGEGIEFLKEFALYQNYPNPICNSTTISFIPAPGVEKSEIKIYNIKGQLVKQFKRQKVKILRLYGTEKMIMAIS
ncbi:MAG: C10 family peptidase [Candidatus Cloacimonadota bacterium]|nr:C10 family peptidase [Candidatus Cloacimonadota bacterium]